eukprot:12419105-Alexandrium_andersonii.AAC.1
MVGPGHGQVQHPRRANTRRPIGPLNRNGHVVYPVLESSGGNPRVGRLLAQWAKECGWEKHAGVVEALSKHGASRVLLLSGNRPNNIASDTAHSGIGIDHQDDQPRLFPPLHQP